MLHCHIDFHFAHGMGLIMQEGDLEEMPEAHHGMPTCGSFAPPPLPSASTSTVQVSILLKAHGLLFDHS